MARSFLPEGNSTGCVRYARSGIGNFVPARWSATGFSLIGLTNPNSRPFFPATTEEGVIAKFKKLDREMKGKGGRGGIRIHSMFI